MHIMIIFLLITTHLSSSPTYHHLPTITYRVTMAWYDPPAVTGSTGSALIHDLDLTVTSPSGQV
jgi:hypothetical protein